MIGDHKIRLCDPNLSAFGACRGFGYFRHRQGYILRFIHCLCDVRLLMRGLAFLPLHLFLLRQIAALAYEFSNSLRNGSPA